VFDAVEELGKCKEAAAALTAVQQKLGDVFEGHVQQVSAHYRAKTFETRGVALDVQQS
jgi:hypothetical protein